MKGVTFANCNHVFHILHILTDGTLLHDGQSIIGKKGMIVSVRHSMQTERMLYTEKESIRLIVVVEQRRKKDGGMRKKDQRTVEGERIHTRK